MIIRIILIALISICFNATAYAKYETIPERNHYNNTYVELNQNGKNKEALEVLKEWAQKYPDDPTVYGYWGFLLLEEKKYEESLPKFEKATQLAPRYDVAYSGWGEALYNLARYQEAKEKFKKAIQILPMPYYYYFLGKTLYNLKQYDEALVNFKKIPNEEPVDIDDIEVQKDTQKYIKLIESKKKSTTP